MNEHIKMNVLAFGIAKEIFNQDQISFDLHQSIEVKELRERIISEYPKMRRLASFLIAVNGEYADENQLLSPEDEIAVIPPVSGG